MICIFKYRIVFKYFNKSPIKKPRSGGGGGELATVESAAEVAFSFMDAINSMPFKLMSFNFNSFIQRQFEIFLGFSGIYRENGKCKKVISGLAMGAVRKWHRKRRRFIFQFISNVAISNVGEINANGELMNGEPERRRRRRRRQCVESWLAAKFATFEGVAMAAKLSRSL